MSVLENFKNIPRSPYGGATGIKCNFFSSNLQRSPWRKKKTGPVAHPSGDQPVGLAYRRQGGQSPLPQATHQAARPAGAGGPVAHPASDRGGLSPPPRATGSAHPYIRPPPHSLLI